MYALLRIWGLTDPCIWFDEIFSVHAAEHSWGTMLGFVAQDLIHPPLFYLLLKVWISVGGDGLFWLRLFPVLLSLLATAPFLLICRELKLRSATAAVALGLFAFNGALIKYAQEVRMYSLLLFLSLVSIWLFSRFFIRGKSLVALVIVNVLLVYTHYFGGLVVLAEVGIIVWAQRIKTGQILLMAGIVLLAFTPWLFAVLRAGRRGADLGQNIGWIDRPGINAFLDLFFDLIEPLYFQASSDQPSTLIYISLPLLLVIAWAMLIYAAGFAANIRGPEEEINLKFLGVLTIVPIAAAALASWLSPYSVWGSRHLIIVFAPAAILIAICVTEQPRPVLTKAAIGSMVVLTALAALVRSTASAPEYVWCTWERAGTSIAAESDLPKTVYAFDDLSAYHLWYSLRKDPVYSVGVVDGINGDVGRPAYFLPRAFDEVSRHHVDSLERRPSILVFHGSRAPVEAFTERGFRIGKEKTFRTRGSETSIVEVY